MTVIQDRLLVEFQEAVTRNASVRRQRPEAPLVVAVYRYRFSVIRLQGRGRRMKNRNLGKNGVGELDDALLQRSTYQYF